ERGEAADHGHGEQHREHALVTLEQTEDCVPAPGPDHETSPTIASAPGAPASSTSSTSWRARRNTNHAIHTAAATSTSSAAQRSTRWTSRTTSWIWSVKRNAAPKASGTLTSAAAASQARNLQK